MSYQLKEFPSCSTFVDLAADNIFEQGIKTPENLGIALALARIYPNHKWSNVFENWEQGVILHPKNFSKVKELLNHSSISFPKIHFVWNELFQFYFGNEDKSLTNVMPFTEIWTKVVDGNL
jgi:hypothetical protein